MAARSVNEGESSMKNPACANCIRRNEVCEYPSIIHASNASVIRPLQFQDGITNAPLCELDAILSDLGTFVDERLPWIQPNPRSHISDMANREDVDSHISLLFKSVLNRSWLTPAETALWTNALVKSAAEHPYLQHCMFSLAYLRRDLLDQPLEGTSISAYQHQLIASTLFRQGAPVVDAENWIAIVTFHVFMLVFQFATQSICSDSDFNLVETLRVLRSSNTIEEEANPFFEKSKFWELIMKRTTPKSCEVDFSLSANLQALAGIIADSLEHHANDPDDEEQAEINRQAYTELREWISSCDAHPRRWNQYCLWPGRVTPEFLDLLADKDDVALLLVIHWCAVLYRSPKPSVCKWAHRAAYFAIHSLSDRSRWDSLLIWPLQTFCEPRIDPGFEARLAKASQLSNAVVPEQAAALFNLSYSESNSVALKAVTTTSLPPQDALGAATSLSDTSIRPANERLDTETKTNVTSGASASMLFGGAAGPFDDFFMAFTTENVDPSLLASTSGMFDMVTTPATLDDFGIAQYPTPLSNIDEGTDMHHLPNTSMSMSLGMEADLIPVQGTFI
ncbi:Nn.00g081070.m01.CDS01 [Neocucurbitaria sp. VM-36]